MAHYCARIDIELSSEHEDHCQQRPLSLPMFHLLSLVLDIDTYNYLSFIGLRAFASSGLGASGSAYLTFQSTSSRNCSK